MVHHRPLRVYNGKHFKAVGYRSQAWKSRVLILEENDLLKLINEKVAEPDTEEDKFHWKKSDARGRKILVESVRYHLVLLSPRTGRRVLKAQTVGASARRQLSIERPMSPHPSLLASGWLFSSPRGVSLS